MTLSFILDDFLPALQLGQTGDEEENIFNEITVEERRARIDSIIRYFFQNYRIFIRIQVPPPPVLRIRIHRIHMFLGLPDPDPLVRGIDPDLDPSIIMQ
jgi:hypothetical protein